MSLTVFFSAHRVLVDAARLHAQRHAVTGQIMAADWGGKADDWEWASEQIAADWDSYYADLNLSGDEGLNDLYEGLYRTTRGLFRLTNTPEPPQPELTALSRTLPGRVAARVDALYPDVTSPAAELAQNHRLAVASQALSDQVEGWLTAGGVREYFQGPIIGPAEIGHPEPDEGFYLGALLMAGAEASQSVAVVGYEGQARAAESVGIAALVIRRDDSSGDLNTLSDLPAALRRIRPDS